MDRVPGWDHEESLLRTGAGLIAGLDEVGRGPIAGPVVAGAVVFDPSARPAWAGELRDSKLLEPSQRERLAALIWRDAPAAGVGAASPREVDALGIAPASRLAMLRALAALPVRPSHLLIDAFSLPETPLPQEPVVHGDRICVSIAAASIIAKVARDRWMCSLGRVFAGYGFESHKGYASPAHIEAIRRLGYSPLHRRSFTVRALLEVELPGFETAKAAR